MTSQYDGAAAAPTPPLLTETPGEKPVRGNPWGADSGGSGDGTASGEKGADKGGGKGKGGGGKPTSPWLPGSLTGDGLGGSQRPGNRRLSIDAMLRNGPFGPQLPRLPGNLNPWLWGTGAVLALWLAFTSIHRLDPEEEGVITRFGSYSRTIGPGVSMTLPAPFERVVSVPVRIIQTETIPGTAGQNLVLTGDQNIINMAYTISWRVKDPEQYLFEADDQKGTIRDAAESAMRATLANFSLAQAIGSGKDAIELSVRTRLQQILDSYRMGVQIEGVAINDASPPTEVEEAFNNVNVARQRSESFLNDARAYAQQAQRGAEGGAIEFNKIYEEYRLAPEVTRRRLYYETMEAVLRPSDKTVVSAGGNQTYMALPEVRRRSDPAAQPPAAAAGGE